ncbi:hypothetical protein [Tepidimonas taiwanensis]|uniref:hypothetical protein n=1 Tax=Tepidimonas taiwanensis TaxID=307486 RepID=UPI00073410CB|nr:hypothetical protein [Tepidimonas taiwanensis]
MANALDDLDRAAAAWRSRRRRQRRRVWVGLAVMALGYLLVAVAPDAATEWVMIRVFAGFAALLGGAALVVGPLIEWALEG